jgi:hypothetical protein
MRRDTVFVSSVLFTVALIIPLPKCLSAAQNREDLIFQAGGFACLSNIFIGLLVTWTAFVKGIRWAWCVMCIIVWVGAFPILALPVLQNRKTLSLSLTEWVYSALFQSGIPRAWAEGVLLFVLMLLALVLPLKSFFWRRETGATRRPPEVF